MELTLGEVVASIGGQLTDLAIEGKSVRAIRSLALADDTDLSFYRGDPRYLPQVRATRALAIVTDGPIEGATRPLVIVEDTGLAVSFLLAAVRDLQNPPVPGVHPRASVDPLAELGPDVTVGPGAVVEAHAKIGARSRIGAQTFVGRGTVLGEDCVLHPGAMVLHSCILGARVVVWPNAVIGRDGFGFLQRDGRHVRIPQVGGVIIGDDVEVGSFTSIDRGAVDPTIVEQGVKIDSHCHIAHNCKIGENAMLIGATRMGGSVTIGKGAICGSGSGINERLTIGDGAMLGATTKVLIEDVPAGAVMWGTPARPIGLEKRIQVLLTRLPEMHKELRDLRKRVMAQDTSTT
jgi:UDP-3-O-[3-hydroxymyristoyl] glucosamine N-acyltransferase